MQFLGQSKTQFLEFFVLISFSLQIEEIFEKQHNNKNTKIGPEINSKICLTMIAQNLRRRSAK